MGVCITPQGCLTDAAGGVLGAVAQAVTSAAGEMVTELFGWWTRPSSLSVDTTFVHVGQQYVTTWMAVPVAVLALLAGVGWGVLGGSHAWIADTFRGLLVLGITAAGSIPVIAALQVWSTSLSRGLLGATPARDIGTRVIELMALQHSSPASAMFWSTLVLLVGAFQYLVMLFRDGAVLVLTVALPIAAAGQFSRGSLLWLPKVAGWLLGFIFLKPAAALVYFVGLSAFGQADGLQGLATAVCVMLAALFALPAMLKVVTFAVTPAPMQNNALAMAATVAGVGASAAQLFSRRSRAGGAAPDGAPVAGSASSAVSATGPAGMAATAAVEAASTVRRTAAQGVTPDPSNSRESS